MLVAVDGALAGLIAVADPIMDSSFEALTVLREDGLRLVNLTGDTRTTAVAVARRLGSKTSWPRSSPMARSPRSNASSPKAARW